jgi:hypothetical protein
MTNSTPQLTFTSLILFLLYFIEYCSKSTSAPHHWFSVIFGQFVSKLKATFLLLEERPERERRYENLFRLALGKNKKVKKRGGGMNRWKIMSKRKRRRKTPKEE